MTPVQPSQMTPAVPDLPVLAGRGPVALDEVTGGAGDEGLGRGAADFRLRVPRSADRSVAPHWVGHYCA
jgi:uncharacterized Fe-S center protein